MIGADNALGTALYAETLQQAADKLVEYIRKQNQTSAPKQQLKKMFYSICEATTHLFPAIILLLRKLLDNRERAQTAKKWYLRPLLDELVEMLEQGQQMGEIRQGHSLALVYHLLGVTQYFAISLPTLKPLYSEEEFEQLKQEHMALLESIMS